MSVSSPILLSIVIPAYNEAEMLGGKIQKIRHAMEGQSIGWELIVCDNQSTDTTVELAKAAGAKVISEPHHSISKARNTGASIAQGQWMLFVDADTYPLPALMSEVIVMMEERKAIGCGSTVEVVGGSTWNKLRMERLNPFMRAFGWCGGAFLLCESEAFRQIGGFSEDLYALEEIDFVFRLKKYGRKEGKSFQILHQHPVITSGRKGDAGSFVHLFVSTLFSLIFFLLHYVLPKALRPKASKKLLRYWYQQR